MNAAIIFLAVVLIWPADNSGPQLGHGQFPSAEACLAAKTAFLADAAKNDKVRSVNFVCLSLARGDNT
jgi:hypothetical protein